MTEPADEYDRLKAQKDAIERKQRIRPIRSEADHKAALSRIDSLMDAEPGTERGDELDVLVDLVQHYESKREPWAHAPVAQEPACKRCGATVLTACLCVTDEREADALLIAAAPDLLAALKEAVRDFAIMRMGSRMEKWDAAIAKAEGR